MTQSAILLLLLLAEIFKATTALQYRLNEPDVVSFYCNASDTSGKHLLLAHDGAGNWQGLIRVECPVIAASYGLSFNDNIAAVMSLQYLSNRGGDYGIVSISVNEIDSNILQSIRHVSGLWDTVRVENMTLRDLHAIHIPQDLYMIRSGRSVRGVERRLWMEGSYVLLPLEIGQTREAQCPDGWSAHEPLFDTACHFSLHLDGVYGMETLTAFGTATESTFAARLPDGWVVDTTFRDTGHLVHVEEDGRLLAISPSGVVAMNVTVNVDGAEYGPILLAPGGNATITQLEVKPFYSVDTLFSVGDTPVMTDNVYVRRKWGDAEFFAYNFLHLGRFVRNAVATTLASAWEALF
jgi:hypothetical protein